MSARVRTEAQKDAAKRKRAENPAATKKASKKWYDANPAKVRAYVAQLDPDEVQKQGVASGIKVSKRCFF